MIRNQCYQETSLENICKVFELENCINVFRGILFRGILEELEEILLNHKVLMKQDKFQC